MLKREHLCLGILQCWAAAPGRKLVPSSLVRWHPVLDRSRDKRGALRVVCSKKSGSSRYPQFI